MLPIYRSEEAKVRQISSTCGRKFLGSSQMLIRYSFKANENENKAQQRLVVLGMHHHLTQSCFPSPLEELADAVIAEVKADHCFPVAPGSPSSQRGFLQFIEVP